jgi:hypothetical protein
MKGSSSTTTATGFSFFFPSPAAGRSLAEAAVIAFFAAAAAIFSAFLREDFEGGSVETGSEGIDGSDILVEYNLAVRVDEVIGLIEFSNKFLIINQVWLQVFWSGQSLALPKFEIFFYGPER